MVYLVSGFVKVRHNGKGATYLHTTDQDSHMVFELWPDEPRANARAKALVEDGPCLWATYERREKETI